MTRQDFPAGTPSYSGAMATSSTRTLTALAYAKIKEEILSLRLAPRQQLTEQELSVMLDMSKTPIREALLMLRHEGLVETNAFKGARVRDLRLDDAVEIYQLRAELEPLALRLSHQHSSSADYDELRAVLAEAAERLQTGDRVGLAELNRAFHLGLVARCPNRRLLDMVRQFSDQVRLISMRGWVFRPTMGDEAQEHAAILDAVAIDDDADAASDLLRKHIRRFVERNLEHRDA